MLNLTSSWNVDSWELISWELISWEDIDPVSKCCGILRKHIYRKFFCYGSYVFLSGSIDITS